MQTFCSAIATANRWVARIASYLILPIVAFTTVEVVLRYVFNRPTIWVWDANVQLLCAMMFLGAGYLLLEKGHVAVDVISSRWSLKSRAIVDLVTSVFFFGSIAILVWQGAIVGWQGFLIRETYPSVWRPPVYPLKVLVTAGALLLLLQGAAKFINDLGIVTGKSRGS